MIFCFMIEYPNLRQRVSLVFVFSVIFMKLHPKSLQESPPLTFFFASLNVKGKKLMQALSSASMEKDLPVISNIMLFSSRPVENQKAVAS